MALIYFGQGRLIYLPRQYPEGAKELAKVDIVRFSPNGMQQQLYLPKRAGNTAPESVWWIFGGNGSVALDWVGAVEAIPSRDKIAFVLFDYPGYGANQGSPSPRRIADSIEVALPEVAAVLKLSQDELLQRSQTIGHSLGAAVAFDFANRYELSQVIAISPFTTMEEMAKRTVGAWAAPLLRHRYDNEKLVDAILESGRPVEITIFHGEEDSLIPPSMGRSLAARDESGEHLRFISVPRAGHNDVVSRILPELIGIVTSTTP